MILKLKNGFNRMSDPTLETRANQILGHMYGNPNFPAPVPTGEEMEAFIGAFSSVLTQCKNGDRVKIAEKNQNRKLLVQKLHLWSHYVLLKSEGDEVKALSSGFSIAAASSTRPPLQKPAALSITNGINNGEILCKGKRVAGAVSYVFEFATLEGMTSDQWNRIAATKTKQTISNLNRGTLYYCRIGAIGSNNQLVYSDVTSRTAA